MKKALQIMKIVVLMTFCTILAACGSQTSQSDAHGIDDVEIEGLNSDTPSEEMILEDLNTALLEKNEYASLENVETVKSLTEEGEFEITLEVAAKTKYADWIYNVDLYYTLYDQGWWMDEIRWNSEEYECVRIPDVETMGTYVMTYTANMDVGPSFVNDYLLTMEDASIAYNDGILTYEWTNIKDHLNWTEWDRVYTSWSYNATTDNWDIMYSDDGYLDYAIDDKILARELDPQIDFSGIWYGEKACEGFVLEIIDFTWEGFTANITLRNETTTHYFTATDSINTDGDISIYCKEPPYYVDESGYYIGFYKHSNIIDIIFQEHGHTTIWYVTINEELPTQPGVSE